MPLIDDVRAFAPGCEQETADQELILRRLEQDPGIWGRESTTHLTTSAWTLDERGERVLLVYHKIYDSWSWAVALRELEEETGVSGARVAAAQDGCPILSLEALPVAGHVRRGAWVPSHTHLNVTYLVVADAEAPLRVAPDENSGVRWAALDDVCRLSTEAWMCEHVYKKLIERTRALLGK